MNMPFVKMQGCGNDYVYLDGVNSAATRELMDRESWPELVRRMSDRHKGIGSDGVIVLCPPTTDAAAKGATVRMRMFNADGSESEMCGNGVRCVAKFAHDRLGVRQAPMQVETGRGVLSIKYEVSGGRVVSATVDMGEPVLELKRVPVDERHMYAQRVLPLGVTQYALPDFKGTFDWMFVSMGNPHAVSWDACPPKETAGPNQIDARQMIERVGPVVERYPAFPNKINVHIVRSDGTDRAEVFTWERGAGVTQACGTGACAALVAGVLSGRLGREATMCLLGGELRIRWDATTNHVFMTGEAVDVFEGVWTA